MKKILVISMVLLNIFSVNSFASEAQEKIYLTQILNQLDAIQPLAIVANKAQPQNTRIQFHYTRYRDNQGQLHNGLLEDIQAIKAGITQKLNDSAIEPRVVAPIKGDYINNK
jgi:RAQPRD family integrative conjugative element protein